MDDDTSPLFMDTNVLIYAHLTESPLYAEARHAIQIYYDAGRELWVSRQIFREYIAALTRDQDPAKRVAIGSLVSDIRRFETEFKVAEDSPNVTARLLDLMLHYSGGGKQVHDANIVATMLTHGSTNFSRTTLLTLVASLILLPSCL